MVCLNRCKWTPGFEMTGSPHLRFWRCFKLSGDLDLVSDLQIRLWVDGTFRQPEQVSPSVRKHAAEMNRVAVKNGTWAIADASPLNPLSPPAAGRLDEIKVPVLIIVGSLDNPEILRAADLLENKIENAKKVIMPDCAHVPNMEKPEEFNRNVLNFLRNL